MLKLVPFQAGVGTWLQQTRCWLPNPSYEACHVLSPAPSVTSSLPLSCAHTSETCNPTPASGSAPVILCRKSLFLRISAASQGKWPSSGKAKMMKLPQGGPHKSTAAFQSQIAREKAEQQLHRPTDGTWRRQTHLLAPVWFLSEPARVLCRRWVSTTKAVIVQLTDAAWDLGHSTPEIAILKNMFL